MSAAATLEKTRPTTSKRNFVEDVPEYVKLKQAGLSEVNDEIIAQGFLDIHSMRALKIGTYQREKLAGRGRGKLLRAAESGARLPNITLGLRSSNYEERGSVMTLVGDVYIIDGLQRVTALLQLATERPDDIPNIVIGAEVRFNTNEAKEKELFHVLNMDRTRMSANVILRNSRDQSRSLLTLYGLSKTKDSPICNRVQWNQNMARGELLTGVLLVNVAMALFKNIEISPGKGKGTVRLAGGSAGVVSQLERRVDKVGLENFRRTVLTFWKTIDEIWGIQSIEYATKATWLRGNFLMAVANLFSQHENFWDGSKLVVDMETKRKLRAFAINDPDVVRLSGSGNSALPMLFSHLVVHFNKGKKINRLRSRATAGDDTEE